MKTKRTTKELPPVLDVCCGGRSFWFNKNDPRALYVDKRKGVFPRVHLDYPRKPVTVSPDHQGSFTDLPYPDDSFNLVVFDPPHLLNAGSGNIFKFYGSLEKDWKEDLSQGFKECFRVLVPLGTLIFKWNETQIKVQEILRLTDHTPLFGHRSGKLSKTHWIAFLKEDT